jgi:hypothetical protein
MCRRLLYLIFFNHACQETRYSLRIILCVFSFLGLCWGNGPAHVRVSGPLCGLEEFLVNTASTRGSEENNHQGLGGKSPSTSIPIYRRVFVIDGTRNKW